MKGPRALGWSFCFALAFAAFFTSAVLAQSEFSAGPGGRQPIPDKSASPRTTDPQAYDAIDLFSRICVSTHGDRAQTQGIVGDGDAAIEKMEPDLVRGLENGAEGGIGWIISMPLGDKILLELPGTGGCLVRAPRVNTAQLETAFRNLMEQYAGSGRFGVRRLGDQTKTIDEPARPAGPNGRPATPAEKIKFHLLGYRMTMPGSDQTAEIILASTESMTPAVQATLSFDILPAEKAGAGPR
jgi:hypothetical protein